ncbi:glycosyltransferase family 9 protein [Actinomycetospora chiangmaiensis]|uniref:glycosyltransferase family 9 protein n=1 Tax=Actinomycetospora chiangmaiensis TaxID=402650 RepID=UPI0003612E7C|nr:glycosyltransferase family 9 protein [Actinomycetospora chiangmaiensis]
MHVLRDLGLGDLLVAVPALRLLRRALPDERFVLHGPGWVRDVPGFPVVPDDVSGGTRLTPDVRTAPLTLVNLHGRGPQSHERLDALAEGRPAVRIGHAAPGWDGPPWTDDPTRPERRRWCDLLAACGVVTPDEAAAGADDLRLPVPPPPVVGIDPRVELRSAPSPGSVVIHPGAAFGAKRWPVERFAAVARAVADAGHDVVVTGGPDETALTGAVPGRDLAGRTSIGELCRLVAHARMVIAGDTGIAHVATAYGTPSVTLFGPVGPEQWGPPAGDPRHVTLTDASVRRGERFADEPDPALLAVGVDDVLRVVMPQLTVTSQGQAGDPGVPLTP